MNISKREFALMVIPVIIFLVGVCINPLISTQYSVNIGVVGYIAAMALVFWLGELVMALAGDDD